MFKYFCNKCFWTKTVKNPNIFYFSTCGHIYCQECKPTRLCHICKAPYLARTIDANMSNSMAIYFESPLNAYCRFQKIVHFQTMQDTLAAHYNVNYLSKRKQSALKKLNGMLRIDEQLDENLAHESKRIEKLETYLAYKNHCSQELHQRHQRPARGRSSKVSAYGRFSGKYHPPQTPTISTVSDVTMSSANFTKSTNLSKESDSFLHHTANDFTL